MQDFCIKTYEILHIFIFNRIIIRSILQKSHTLVPFLVPVPTKQKPFVEVHYFPERLFLFILNFNTEKEIHYTEVFKQQFENFPRINSQKKRFFESLKAFIYKGFSVFLKIKLPLVTTF